MMISLNDIKKYVLEEGSGIAFTMNDKKCGMEPEVTGGIFTFFAWCGKETKQYTNYNSMLNDKFFDGYSLVDLARQEDPQFYFF